VVYLHMVIWFLFVCFCFFGDFKLYEGGTWNVNIITALRNLNVLPVTIKGADVRISKFLELCLAYKLSNEKWSIQMFDYQWPFQYFVVSHRWLPIEAQSRLTLSGSGKQISHYKLLESFLTSLMRLLISFNEDF
jgi:hypothetical protein